MNFCILTSKKQILSFFILSFLLINCIGLVNYIVDPMWVFQHKNYLKVNKLDFDERQQKTNFLYFVNNNFENIILGSSRATYLNKSVFNENIGKTFNYAANAMDPYEYELFLEHFSTLNSKQPSNIILGIDFFGANKNRIYRFSKSEHLSNAQNIFYRLKLLYSIDIFRFSYWNIKNTLKNKKAYYDIEMIKKIELNKDIASSVKDFTPYEYDEQILNYYIKLQKKYHNSNFIVFTPPVSFEQLLRNHQNGLDKDYFQWLRDLVKVFGNVYHFMYPNEFTNNDQNFYDANHFHNISGEMIAKDIISGIKNSHMNNGIILNQNNIEQFIKDYGKLLLKDLQ